MGVFPEPHNLSVCKLLFLLAHWHGLAKLRLHTDETLEVLEEVSGRLGRQLCLFANEMCSAFSTQELCREAESRRRRQAREGESGMTQTQNRRPKLFNLRTYKLHALGDYPAQIRMYGTTDSYSTQLVSHWYYTDLFLIYCLQGELEHQTSKSRFVRTSRKAFVPQMAAIERRQTRIRRIRMRQEMLSTTDPTLEVPEQHHVIGKSWNFPNDINVFLQSNFDDPAVKVSRVVFTSDTELTVWASTGLPPKTQGPPPTSHLRNSFRLRPSARTRERHYLNTKWCTFQRKPILLPLSTSN